MSGYKVLVVDDSVVYRTQTKAALLTLSYIESVSVASNGRLAIDRLKVQPVDLIILDLEMPEMDGVSTLKELNRQGIKSKVIVFSSLSKRGAEITMEALHNGASDFVTKPDSSSVGDPKEKILNLLQPKIECLLDEKESRIVSPTNNDTSYPKVRIEGMNPEIILIGSSTGGPTVLEEIFSNLKGTLRCPIVIAQHMPPLFTATLAERLAKISGLIVKEAQHGEKLGNQVYVAPGNYHLRLKGEKGNVTLALDQGEQINFVRPAVDPLFESASQIFKSGCMSFVLTGMGRDGAIGASEIKKNGGGVIIQNKESCVVFGMPGAIYESGHYDLMSDPKKIIQLLQNKALKEY